ncbi:hypothetical protein NDU88_007311 [Pleurodeles waltl]|uniref:Uncharacterized protein n=1 Tax=Pleurodeles waltl TaxID=8319 RepID=A0AAV7PM68_PLEWA|nr:hypothetical protein NDU88_007311 [Pleurodeles waltl]
MSAAGMCPLFLLPAEKLRTSAAARAARTRSPSAVRLTGGRCSWALAADPRRAVSCAGRPDRAEACGPSSPLKPRPRVERRTAAGAEGAARRRRRRRRPDPVVGLRDPVSLWGTGRTDEAFHEGVLHLKSEERARPCSHWGRPGSADLCLGGAPVSRSSERPAGPPVVVNWEVAGRGCDTPYFTPQERHRQFGTTV